MSKDRIIAGNWIGPLFGPHGVRLEWKLSLSTDGTYVRTIAEGSDDPRADAGLWLWDVDSNVITLQATDGETSSWSVLDVTSCERANTLLVLRRIAVASRNLPIILYRVHLPDDERKTWHGGETTSLPTGLNAAQNSEYTKVPFTLRIKKSITRSVMGTLWGFMVRKDADLRQSSQSLQPVRRACHRGRRRWETCADGQNTIPGWRVLHVAVERRYRCARWLAGA